MKTNSFKDIDLGGQLWEECEKCGEEPVYTRFHLCEKCSKNILMKQSRDKVFSFAALIVTKTVNEIDIYDEHTTGKSILCVCKSYRLSKDFRENEVPVPEYYFKKLMKENKVEISSDRQYIIADFVYHPSLGAIFSESTINLLD